MQASNSINSARAQSIAILAIAGVLLVTAAIWANRVSANTGRPSLLAGIPVPIPSDRLPCPRIWPGGTTGGSSLLAGVPVPIPSDRVPHRRRIWSGDGRLV